MMFFGHELGLGMEVRMKVRHGRRMYYHKLGN
jgi:hypothetical protein